MAICKLIVECRRKYEIIVQYEEDVDDVRKIAMDFYGTGRYISSDAFDVEKIREWEDNDPNAPIPDVAPYGNEGRRYGYQILR